MHAGLDKHTVTDHLIKHRLTVKLPCICMMHVIASRQPCKLSRHLFSPFLHKHSSHSTHAHHPGLLFQVHECHSFPSACFSPRVPSLSTLQLLHHNCSSLPQAGLRAQLQMVHILPQAMRSPRSCISASRSVRGGARLSAASASGAGPALAWHNLQPACSSTFKTLPPGHKALLQLSKLMNSWRRWQQLQACRVNNQHCAGSCFTKSRNNL